MSEHLENTLKNQKGQTLVEFVLLLAGIVIISFTFLSQVNTRIADRWQKMVEIVVDDESQQITVR